MSKDEKSEGQMKIAITPKVYEKIMEYAQSCNLEISGLGSINQSSQVFDRLFPLYPQTCSGAETEISEEFLREITESGQSARANVWWHSHVMMGVFWSGQDQATIEALGQTYSWLLSIVVNKKREYKARFDLFKPARATFEVSLLWHYQFPYEEIERIRAEVKEKVNLIKKEPSIVIPGACQDGHMGFLNRLDENRLKEFGYKRVNGALVKMTTEEYIEWNKSQKKGNNNGGSEQSSLFDRSQEFPYGD